MGLKEYLVRRIFDSIIVVFLIFLLNFFLFYVRFPEVSGLPILQKFTGYLRFVFIDGFRGGGFPGSYKNIIPAFLSNLPFTVFFWGVSIAVAISLSILFGAIAAYKFGSKIDTCLTVISLSFFLVPTWWLGFVFIKHLHSYFPVSRWYSIQVWAFLSPWSNPLGFLQDVLWHMLLPIASLTLSIAGIYYLVVRNSMMKFRHQPFVTTAKAKGLSSAKIIFKHILRNAILPITAIAALTPIIVINEAVSVENTFSLPGGGYFLYRSVVSLQELERSAATPSMQVIFLTLAFVTVGIQFIFDIAHHSLDPRLRTDGGRLEHVKRAKLKLKIVGKRFMKKKSGIAGLTILLLFILIAVLAPILPLYDPEEYIMFYEATPPSMVNPLGTDEWGRDVLSRLIWASRVSLAEFFGALGVALSIGCAVGLLSGFYDRKWFSYVLDRITDVFVSIPLIVFVVYFPLDPGFPKWILSVGIASWGITAKIVRSEVITIKGRAYIDAAKAAGAGNMYIILHYILPEVLPVIASSVVYTGALVIGLQSSLDFLGFRRFTWSRLDILKTPSVITWGSIASYGTTAFLASGAWWIFLPPAICMVLLGLSLVGVADAISYAFNPQL